jgi:hypothetical protein
VDYIYECTRSTTRKNKSRRIRALKQPPTPLETDNSTANGIMNKTVKQKQSKAIDMRFCWLQDQVEQGQFKIYWAPGKYNLAECF